MARLALIALGGAYYSGLRADAARALLTAAPMQLAIEYHNFEQSVGRDRISPMALAEYSDDSLAGYADEQFGKGGERLEDQQRGLVLSLVEETAGRLADGAVIAEVGTGNGDVCAYLADRFPALAVIGADLSVAVAERKHQLPNLRFAGGYALELLESGELDAQLVFASSTFVVFTPLELARYCHALAARRVETVVLNEPTWGPPSRRSQRHTVLAASGGGGLASRLRRLPTRRRLRDRRLVVPALPATRLAAAGRARQPASGAAVRHNLAIAKYEVNDAGVARARQLIEARQYVLDSDWGDVQPRAAAENAFLESHSWDEYGGWHLALTDGPADDTKARYAFVYGDFRRLHRTGLIACHYRAAEWRHKEVELAAHELLQLLDAKSG